MQARKFALSPESRPPATPVTPATPDPLDLPRTLWIQMHVCLHAKIFAFSDFHLFDLTFATVRLE
jgi:hypothetical protein